MSDSVRRWPLLLGGAGLVMLAALPLLPWSDNGRTPHSLHVLVTVPNERRLSTELIEDLRSVMATLLAGLHNTQPDLAIQMLVFHEQDVQGELERRNRSGMGPDVLYTNAQLAFQLQRQGLTEPLQPSRRLTGDLEPDVVRSLQLEDGRLVGLPVLLHPQLACFDRRRIPSSPRRIEALLENPRWRVGLPLETINLIWTLGSISGLSGLEAITRPNADETVSRPALRRWLSWLTAAEQSTSVTFFASQQDLQEKLPRGELDWISCRSDSIHGLRRRMGARLGLAPLPAGPGGQASPLARTRVFSLGVNSSRQQRLLSESLLQLLSNRSGQHRIGMQLSGAMPVNTSVQLPQNGTIQAIRQGQEQTNRMKSLQAQLRQLDSKLPMSDGILASLIYGEVDVEETADRMLQLMREPRP
ncbi:MAG: hypothetical protein VKK62_06430 [Synechococcaceae cyanobacterium]|nr:hypothetical protein [Synechococcaceae cyanobacterium]